MQKRKKKLDACVCDLPITPFGHLPRGRRGTGACRTPRKKTGKLPKKYTPAAQMEDAACRGYSRTLSREERQQREAVEPTSACGSRQDVRVQQAVSTTIIDPACLAGI